MPLDDTAPTPPPGFALDSPTPPPAQADTGGDGIPTITVRPQTSAKQNAGNEGGAPTPPPGFKLDSQPRVEGSRSSQQSPGGAAGFSVTPPPADKAPIVEQAAQKYGVPLEVAHFVGSTESGWNDTALNKSSGTSGAWQFKPATAKQYGVDDPTDFASSTDGAMHYLSDLAQKNGGDWEKAVAQYGTFSTGQGADKDAAVRQNFRDYVGAPQQPRSVGQDVAQGAGRGLIEGSGSVLGMPADLWGMMDRGYQYALTKGAEKLGLISPEEGEQLRQPITTAKGENIEQSPVSSQAVNNHLMKLSGSMGADTSAPQTPIGQASERMASFLPGAATFGASKVAQIPGAIAKYGLLPGAASEVAGEMTKGTEAEPYARMAGAVLPAVVGGGYSALAQRVNPINRAVSSITPSQETDAQALLDKSRTAGAPVTVPEAVDQVTNKGTGIGDIARNVEQSPEGGAIMKPFYAARPAQTEALGRSTFDQISPQVTAPYEVAPRIQEAADTAMSAAANARSAATKPFYDAAKGDTVPVADMDALLDRIDGMISDDKTGLLSPSLTKFRDSLTETPAQAGTAPQRVVRQTPTGSNIYSYVPGTPGTPRVPITDIENLDRARKAFRDQLANPAWAQDAVPKEEIANMRSLLGDLRTNMVQSSPAFSAGKQLHQDITRTNFAPLERSPTGKLAKAKTPDAQSDIMFDTNPLPGSERAVSRTVRQLVASDPEAAAQMVRMHIEKTFNEAIQENLPGANQAGGPKFSSVVKGNPQQAKNLEAAVTALPNGNTKWGALKNTLDILDAMGKRQAMGSPTESNRQLNVLLHSGKLPMEIATTIANPLKWGQAIADMYHNFAYGRNTEALARVFTEGSVADLRNLAGAPPRSLKAQAALVGALARQGAQTTQSPDQGSQ